MSEPKFKIGQRVWCFDQDDYATGVVRSVAFKDVFDPNCTEFEYTILLGFECDLVNSNVWVCDEEEMTDEPLTSKEAKRLRASLALKRMDVAVRAGAAYIARLEKDINKEKEKHLRTEHKRDILKETLRQLK